MPGNGMAPVFNEFEGLLARYDQDERPHVRKLLMMYRFKYNDMVGDPTSARNSKERRRLKEDVAALKWVLRVLNELETIDD